MQTLKQNVSPAPLVVIAGPTASGKSALALNLAERFGGEIVSCDSVAIYRGLDIGSAKPTVSERMRIPHHCLDLLDPDEAATAGDYARAARATLSEITARNRLPLVAGGTGLYLRALLHGLAPSPPRDEKLRGRLRALQQRRGGHVLHRLLRRWDPRAAQSIHPNDTPKLIRSLEVRLLAHTSQTNQWAAGRDPLTGFGVLLLGVDPPRPALYERIDARAARMFSTGLLEEVEAIVETYGEHVRVLQFLGYAQAAAVLWGEATLAEAVAAAQQGHRHYAKRQLTWFRREPGIEWLHGFGDDPGVQEQAAALVQKHLNGLLQQENRQADECTHR